MRAIFYYISLSFFLLCGINHLYAKASHKATNSSYFHYEENQQQLKHLNSTHRTLVIESTAIDFDEEFHNDDDFNAGDSAAVLVKNLSLLNDWYLMFTDKFLFKTISTNNIFFEPFSGQSDPIYLKIGVLRI